MACHAPFFDFNWKVNHQPFIFWVIPSPHVSRMTPDGPRQRISGDYPPQLKADLESGREYSCQLYTCSILDNFYYIRIFCIEFCSSALYFQLTDIATTVEFFTPQKPPPPRLVQRFFVFENWFYELLFFFDGKVGNCGMKLSPPKNHKYSRSY